MNLLDEVELHLDSEDASLRDERRERTIFLMRLGYPEQGMVFLNGDSVIRPWMELRTAYIHGYQASLLIGQSFLENLLGGVADFSDQAGGRPGLHDLLLIARENGWLLDTEFGEFASLAKLRNPYAHNRSFAIQIACEQGPRQPARSPMSSSRVTASASSFGSTHSSIDALASVA